jgi:hypothetical protein
MCARKSGSVKKLCNPVWQSKQALLCYPRELRSPEWISDRGSLLTQAVSFFALTFNHSPFLILDFRFWILDLGLPGDFRLQAQSKITKPKSKIT